MRYELSGHEWTAIKPMLPEPRGEVVDRTVAHASTSGVSVRVRLRPGWR